MHKITRAVLVVVAVLAGRVALGNCIDNPPRFIDAQGGVCSAARQEIGCGCSEPFVWDGLLEEVKEGVIAWEVERQRAPSGTWYEVGVIPFEQLTGVETVTRCTGAFPKYVCYDVVTTLYGIERQRIWTPAFDVTSATGVEDMPFEGLLYNYRVRAVRLDAQGAWSQVVKHRIAPIGCLVGGTWVVCNRP